MRGGAVPFAGIKWRRSRWAWGLRRGGCWGGEDCGELKVKIPTLSQTARQGWGNPGSREIEILTRRVKCATFYESDCVTGGVLVVSCRLKLREGTMAFCPSCGSEVGSSS